MKFTEAQLEAAISELLEVEGEAQKMTWEELSGASNR